MPKEDAELGVYSSSGTVIVDNIDPSHSQPTSHNAPAPIIVPRHVVAGVRTEDAYKFEEYEDTCVRMEPRHHCWTPAGEVLLGCKGGQLIKVFHLLMITNPNPLKTIHTWVFTGAGICRELSHHL